MGRKLTNLLMDKQPNGCLHGASKTRIHVAPKISDDSNETKDYEIKECMEEHSEQKPGILSVKINNSRAGLHNIKDEKPGLRKSSLIVANSAAARNGDMNTTENGNTVQPPRTSNTPEPKSPEATLKVFQSDRKHTDEEDSWSLASSIATSVRINKSRVTVGSAPKLRCSDRVERRKEFYNKLEQKQKAIEEEKLQNEQRLKEEQEVAMKQLRKNLIYKANPVPSFYYEAPPPKPELKKLPLTRPKSPKLNRRRSCSDATNSTREEKPKCTQIARHSLGSYKAASSPSPLNNVKNSPQINSRHTNRSSKTKGRQELEKEVEETIAPDTNGQNVNDITAQS